jgi:peptide/nickel transport system substrate-binding protein
MGFRLRRSAIGKIQGVLIIVVLLVVVFGAVYFYSMTQIPGGTTSTSTSQLPTSLASTMTTQFPTSLVVEEESQPDSLDPAVAYTTPGWEIVEQVYQGLVAPDGTSYTTYIGVLAQNWTVSSDGMNYAFSLRPNVKFSNGDPFDAYVMWFSIYRTLLMNQAPAWILGQNLFPGNGIDFNITDQILNSINYASPSSEDLTYLTYANQSVQVVGQYELIIHLGYGYNGQAPYSAFLATLSTPVSWAVDPKVLEANGGVVADEPNNWMETHALGTSFFELQSWIQGQSVTLVRNPNYWGMNVPTAERNYAIQPAILDTINFYYKPASTMIADLRSNSAQVILAPSSQYGILKPIQGLTVSILPTAFGSSENIFFIYMDQYAFAPFQDLRVREAIANAIDYKSIIHTVLNDLATQWIGPVPPGFPYYNESIAGLQPYQYDPVKAASLLADAGYKSTLPNGTELNGSGDTFPSVNFLYDADSYTQSQAAEIIASELHSVGINIVLKPLTFKQYSNVITSSEDVDSTPYPFGISYYSEDYTASIDYVSAITSTGQVGFSGYYNQTVVDWTTAAATALDEGTIIQNFQEITRAMYYDYTDVWLYVPYFMAANRSNVVGMVPNPAGSGMGYFMFYNTVHYSS